MEHAKHIVDILDQNGQIIGQKPRDQVDKTTEIYHGIYVLLITPQGDVVFTPIKERSDLPNIYPGQLGVPTATIRRHGENAEQAARRAVSRELFIDDPELHQVGQEMLELSDSRHTYATLFYIVANPPAVFSKTDISELTTLTTREITKELQDNPDRFAPTMRTLWKKWSDQLPI